ncbi:MAG: class II fructose-bisphosphate aldolase [Gemmatimonadales bacterium]|jgi:fructose-bisphosphate aldolase class II|nr:class II fructose-bisphosphate aldolase [Gemmatimonadales bacterium]NCG32104.1 class II fructose-bisphosphate aldolase [Pseudomonadota bacterium]MBT3499120.1 class II fructose-bisphosphate aldolase [Gemmatimonadales bacterium]MBT3774264.1 class II fructose-bisphosphate aldolase [Gemmatimonadales bacterium]MBT3959672.1 class II fructose-bisphosphate aldolase [Gemmatimonadales bacterium]
MPIATPAQFKQMLKTAQDSSYAYPAINVTSIITLNAAMKGFAESKSDGIIQFSTGAGQFASGLANKDAAYGCIVLAEAAHMLAEQYDVLIALNTDHCQPEKAEGFLKPLIEATAARRAAGKGNLFQNHMLDASILPLEENIAICDEYLRLCAANEIVLEVEAGVVGGEEDGAAGTEDMPDDMLYTTPEDMVTVYEALQGIGQYTFAATFGNVHGHYKPGAVKLRPEILKDGQAAVIAKYGADAEMDLVFHGGSGSQISEIRETLDYGVVKMNVDTDTQYAFTRPVADHMLSNYDAVLKIDGEIGNKKLYDPRSYLKAGEEGMSARVCVACEDLLSSGKTLFGQI